mgnify:CR=1 FL=1
MIILLYNNHCRVIHFWNNTLWIWYSKCLLKIVFTINFVLSCFELEKIRFELWDFGNFFFSLLELDFIYYEVFLEIFIWKKRSLLLKGKNEAQWVRWKSSQKNIKPDLKEKLHFPVKYIILNFWFFILIQQFSACSRRSLQNCNWAQSFLCYILKDFLVPTTFQ